MPTYDYVCHHNGRTLEVRHAMSHRVATWSELAALAGVDAAGTPPDAPVEKVLGTGGVVRSEHLGSGVAPACGNPNPCCGGGACGYMG
ncbi:MAG: zinc ribbon domain-containing protein [Gammaproteobacteria bacterium]